MNERSHAIGMERSNDAYLRQQAARESNARTYPRHLPLAIESARGVEIRDVEGNEYIDCLAGAGTLALGHNHPVAVQAMQEAMENDRPLHTLDITTPIKEQFVDALFGSLPDRFTDSAKIQFCSPAGTDAVEAALKLVKTATGKRSVLGFQGAYHGMTHGALGLMGDTEVTEGLSGFGDTQQLPYPATYRNPFGDLSQADIAGHEIGSQYIEGLLSNPDSGVDPAGMIVELVQGEGGAIPAPDAWTEEIRRITREQEVPLIVDEIQTGLGRTGELYAFEHASITPDVLTLSKAVGGGLPLSVVIYDESLDVWEPGAHAGTFRGNQLAMAAGRATIEYVIENNLADHAARMGDRLRSKLPLAVPSVGDVRGRGLMIGCEIVDPTAEASPDGSPPPNPELAQRIQSECFDRGLILELGGRESSTVRFLPPLITTKEQIDEVARIFNEAVSAAN